MLKKIDIVENYCIFCSDIHCLKIIFIIYRCFMEQELYIIFYLVLKFNIITAELTIFSQQFTLIVCLMFYKHIFQYSDLFISTHYVLYSSFLYIEDIVYIFIDMFFILDRIRNWKFMFSFNFVIHLLCPV